MPSGSRPGERRGGRKAGIPNKRTAALKEYAGQFTEEAINGLVAIARTKKAPHAARVAAWREVLDRGNGKAPQSLKHEGLKPAPLQVAFLRNREDMQALLGTLDHEAGASEDDDD
jgi:hypothetical protein